MGKKSNHKKQHKKAQQGGAKQSSLGTSAGAGRQLSSLSSVNAPSFQSSDIPKKGQAVLMLNSAELVRSDIRRILILLAIMVLVLVALVIINYQTPFLKETGKSFSSFLKLQ